MRKRRAAGLAIRTAGTAEQLWERLASNDPQLIADYRRAEERPGKCLPYQRAALYRLARQYDRDGARILEIGTWCGNTAVLMALAAPKAEVVTCEPETRRTTGLRAAFAPYPNIRMATAKSWDYLVEFEGPPWDLIFVDGDHNHVVLDLPWFNRLKVGGLMVFHDYTPGTAAGMPCQPVYDGVNALGAALGREPDVLIVDQQGIGFAGFYRGEGERWAPKES